MVCASLVVSGVTKAVAMVDRPATTIEVLRNLKFALEHDLFLHADFYADENLKKVFAATNISWDEVSPMRTSGRMFATFGAFFLIRGKVDGQGREALDGKMYGSGIIAANWNAPAVIAAFGKPAKITNPYAAENPVHPTPVMPKTHELGNLAIEYRFESSKAVASFYCLFNGDGTVLRCNFGDREK